MSSAPVLVSIPVVVGQPPIVNSGSDQTICTSSPIAYLSSTIQNATDGIWSGGNGTFNPSNTSLTLAYTPTAAEISLGSVTLTFTSTGAGGGCVNAHDSVTIYYPPLLSVSLGSQLLSCNNSTASLFPTVSGGVTPYKFLWNNGSTSSSINVGAGNYCVNITDVIGCSSSTCSNITVPPALALSMSSADATTNGGSDGSATATPSGGTPLYTYLWSHSGQTTQTATGLLYGVYSAVVADANGCSISLSTVVNEPRCFGFQNIISETDILCNGDLTGTALSTVSGGTAPYTYSWNTFPEQTTVSVSNLGAGTYMATVTEENGCIDVSNIVISQPEKLIATMNRTNASFVGASDGTATANASGGTSPYTYSWSNGRTSSAISNLVAGIYSVTISDNNGCSLLDNVQIYDPPCSKIIMNTYKTNVSCIGASDGTATAQILFGVPPYYYQWSNGATTSTITGLSAGVYSVTGWGTLLCTHFANVTIAEPSILSLGIAPTDISCASVNDGTIDLTVSGGAFPYNFNWSNGVTVEDQYYLSNGNYSVTVTDANLCTSSASTSITRPIQISTSGTKTDVTCYGGSDGSVTITTISGGVFPYAFLWSNGATTQNISGLSKGQYVLTITDANGCHNSLPLSFLVDEPEIASASSITKICPVPLSGVSEVIVTPSGGNGGLYQISFDNGTTFGVAGNYIGILSIANSYSVIVQDSLGCISSVSSITIPDSISLSAVSSAYAGGYNISCNGLSDGNINLTASGGTTAYSYLWNSGHTTKNISNITAGNYFVTVADTNSCTKVLFVPITQPAVLVATASITTNYNGNSVSCNGSADGVIDVTVTGGTTAYMYLWNNSQTTQNISGLGGGTYFVTVTDVNNCQTTSSVTLTQPTVLDLSASTTNVSCHGLSDGAINLSPIGGTSPYVFLWSNSQTTEDITGLNENSYSVTVTDANGCSQSASVNINEQSPIQLLFSSTNPNCYGDNNGSINLSASGGVAPYTYLWSNGATTQNISDLNAGIYIVNVLDGNRCARVDTIIITQPDSLHVVISAHVYPSGYNINPHGSADGSITLEVTGGTSPYTYLWSNKSTTQNLENIPAMHYSVLVSDNHGCTYIVSMTLTEPLVLEMPTGYSPNGDGMNDYFVVHGLEIYPINNIEVYNRWGNIVFLKENYMNEWNGHNNNGDDLPDATYFVVLTINNREIRLTGYVDLRR
ncbi:MAG: gliding motility-associated C-terminal domain-containing protein [Bacteroidetes bacterium]|nr:gliding motility-associated C-terminal domain-containing protein [Bacteroidota bacterium]